MNSRLGRLCGVALAATLMSSCLSQGKPEPGGAPKGKPSAATEVDVLEAPGDPVADTYVAAVSEPQEDSKYGEVGDPGVDALHYDLQLSWFRGERVLRGTETLTFRATRDDTAVQLDFSENLEVQEATFQGVPVTTKHDGKNLILLARVVADRQYQVVLEYSGTVQPVRVPTQRDDLPTGGLTVDAVGGVWTMQEPFGAYTWFAVNDHPSDKALYDFSVKTNPDWQGIANGVSAGVAKPAAGEGTYTWRMADPMAPYLATLAIGPYARLDLPRLAGKPVTVWVHKSPKVVPRRERAAMIKRLRYLPGAVKWVTGKLGPYPFDSIGLLVVDSDSGMETQGLITLGANSYTTSRAVIVHELVHQWYGDLVTPNDWRDLWMNEGMAMYLQLIWQAEQDRVSIDEVMADTESFADGLIAESGPVGDFDDDKFGDGNVYYVPAVMWHEIRGELGDAEFWRIVRGWPRAMAFESANREELIRYFETESDRKLQPIFDKWLTRD